MRIYSYVFHGLFTLFLLLISSVALLSGTELHLGMLPWSGVRGTYVLLGAAIFGLISLLLALKGALRFLFFLWSVAAFALLVKGYFLSSYTFSGMSGFQTAALLSVGSLLAIFGAWFQMRRRTRKS
jgi:drug/metabolite transporter (DMT)-like permease